MQRCINNATGLLNAPLPWGPLCLAEHYVCVRERRDRVREREREAAQVTLVVSLSGFDPGQRGVFGGGTGNAACCFLTRGVQGERREAGYCGIFCASL